MTPSLMPPIVNDAPAHVSPKVNGAPPHVTPKANDGPYHMPPMVNGAHDAIHFADYPSNEINAGPYKVLDQYHSKKSRIRVASVGAGASGLCLAYKMEKLLRPGTWDLVLYEKNESLGGTWYENTYPGCACDIPAHIYTYTFDPKPDWNHFFAYGSDIQSYFKDFADKHNINKYMQLNTKVVEGRWDPVQSIWNITVEDQKTKKRWTDWAHVFINGTGILNSWKWPEIEGLHDFKGPLVHSANWDSSLDFEGKHVAVIGTGSSSVQIVPQIQKVVKKLDVYMRSPTWISPPFGAGVLEKDLTKGTDQEPGQRQYTFTDVDKSKFKSDPEYHLLFRKRIEAEINSLFGMYQRDSALSNQFREVIRNEMNRRMGKGNVELKKFIIPTWSPGCRRISPGDGYLEALVQPNVEPVFSDITKIVGEGLVTADGKLYKADILVCATGFNVAFKPAFKVVNGNGKSIDDDWSSGPNLYMGVSAPRFPNYYTIVGPGATWSNGSLLPGIETTVEYVVQIIDKIQSEGIKELEVKQDALDEIYAHFDAFHKNTVFGEPCRSWFKNGKKEGRIYVWPGSTIHFLKSIKTPRYEDYNIKYRSSNRFAFLGNGEVLANQTSDVQGLSPYVRATDTPWSID